MHIIKTCRVLISNITEHSNISKYIKINVELWNICLHKQKLSLKFKFSQKSHPEKI